MEEARALFRNEKTTEFVIVTIPTVMAVSESGRLAKALVKEGVPLHTLAINQVRLAILQWDSPYTPDCNHHDVMFSLHP